MKAQELKKQNFTVLAFTSTVSFSTKKLTEMRKINYKTRATKNFKTEYYVKTNEDAQALIIAAF